jgi:hypothetical protein
LVRWATVIDRLLTIVSAPTRTATPPNTSRTIRMIEMNCSSPSKVKRSCADAVCTCTPPGSPAASARRTSPRPATRIES